MSKQELVSSEFMTEQEKLFQSWIKADDVREIEIPSTAEEHLSMMEKMKQELMEEEGFDNLEDLHNLVQETIGEEEIEKFNKQMVEPETLKISDDPYNIVKNDIMDKTVVFDLAEEEKERAAPQQTSQQSQTQTKSSSSFSNQKSGSNYSNYSSSNKNNASSTKVSDSKELHEHAARIGDSMQNVAMNNPKYEKIEIPQWGSPWQKFKAFLKSSKARAMMKFTAFVAMQLGFAVKMGKYKVDGPGDYGFYLAYFLGTFFMTKELQSEGWDIRGLGI